MQRDSLSSVYYNNNKYNHLSPFPVRIRLHRSLFCRCNCPCGVDISIVKVLLIIFLLLYITGYTIQQGALSLFNYNLVVLKL